jgi:hypothetical protein
LDNTSPLPTSRTSSSAAARTRPCGCGTRHQQARAQPTHRTPRQRVWMSGPLCGTAPGPQAHCHDIGRDPRSCCPATSGWALMATRGPAVYTVTALDNLAPDPATAIPRHRTTPAAHPPAADPYPACLKMERSKSEPRWATGTGRRPRARSADRRDGPAAIPGRGGSARTPDTRAVGDGHRLALMPNSAHCRSAWSCGHLHSYSYMT